jgi:glycosyltransferase involved in cell wall biosynthesis
MKILHILPSLAKGGPSLVVKELVDALAELGHDVSVGYFDNTVEVNFSPLVSTVNLKFRLEPKFLSKFDIVHTHLYRPDIYGFINRLFIKKLITTVHSDLYQFMGITYGRFMGLIYSLAWSISSCFFDRLVFLTKYQESRYSFSSKISSSSVISNGCKIFECSSNTKEYSQFSGKIILGACANVVKLKRFDQVLKFLSIDKSDSYRFVLVGDGPYLQKLKEMAVNLKVESKVLFVGRTLDVYPYLYSFDIFLMTSESEGMPMAVLEAASCRLPIVSSDLPVIKEVFSNEVSFYELNNLSSLLSAIDYAFNNRLKLGSMAFAKYENKFTNKAMANSYEKLYFELGKKNV